MKSNKTTSLVTPGYTMTFILVTALFFLWALPNNLNDILDEVNRLLVAKGE